MSLSAVNSNTSCTVILSIQPLWAIEEEGKPTA